MHSDIRVANPPPKPLMVFDGDCNFCGVWIRRWRQLTCDAVDYLPSQDPEISDRFPEIPHKHFQTSVQLIEPDGEVYSGAEAVFRALAKNSKMDWVLDSYKSAPGVATVTERAYSFIASHRTTFSFLTRLGWGQHVERPEFYVTRWIFLRALGLIYLVAFVSLWTQITGLIGHNGILPEDQYMAAVKQHVDLLGIGLGRYHSWPTLCWLNSSDAFLKFQCGAGVLFACLLIIGVCPIPSLALLWLLYLSLTSVGGDFLSFQWDILLLEAGFLAIFFAPWQLWPKLSRERPPSRIVLWLLRLLLFKLMFSSGCVKLMSHDPNWRNLTALTFHYQTQPLPTWIAWYANQLPLWFQKFSCAAMFAIELGAPFLIFLPRRIRFFGASAIAFLQILILLTGNYTFFNWLTLALCLLLLDDFALKKLLPGRLTQQATRNGRSPWLLAITIPLAVIYVSVSFLDIIIIFGPPSPKLNPILSLAGWLEPFRSINNYGLFAEMTTERHEIIVQGSDDAVHWSDYEFKYKPGDVTQRPVFVAPFQPRLDWQMWFAALGNYQERPWFENFCIRLLQGSPQVLALLKHNPFPTKPPRYIRAELYDYEFTRFGERQADHAWWNRQFIGEYMPPISFSQ
ncbi:MAG TPA: lipase maturation factor family protein [Candidatus Sulfotelmatobacter sp.]|nr:lipase maturation factor family protein [Candidatus Sulfotelmatobacter sp.]